MMNTNKKTLAVFAALLLLSVVITGCGLFKIETAAQEEAHVDAVGEDIADAPAEEPMVELAEPAERNEGLASDEDFAASAPDAGGGMAVGEAEEVKADEAAPADSIAPMPTSVGNIPDEQFQAHLSAGEINDNADFDEYLQYRHDYLRFVGAETVFDRDVSERHVIEVVDRSGLPVLGAEVLIYQGQTLITSFRTPATGLVYFFPKAHSDTADRGDFEAVVSKGQTTENLTMTRNDTDNHWIARLNAGTDQGPVQLDVLFLLDATGSMSDEIDELKENILSISAQIEALPSRPDVRFGLVSYRDRTDDYVTRVVDFTDDVAEFQKELRNVYAGGGGDTPEALNEGLHDAIWSVDWRIEDTVSMLFLVADAPPHLDYYQDYRYDDEMINAAARGIKILPISSEMPDSFYQQQAEYIFRQLGLFTGGNFIFLTYDDMPQSDGEAGRDDVSVTEDRYTVEDLDALVVRLIQQELAALTAGN